MAYLVIKDGYTLGEVLLSGSTFPALPDHLSHLDDEQEQVNYYGCVFFRKEEEPVAVDEPSGSEEGEAAAPRRRGRPRKGE